MEGKKRLEEDVKALEKAKRILKKHGLLNNKEQKGFDFKISCVKNQLRLERLGIADIVRDFSTVRQDDVH